LVEFSLRMEIEAKTLGETFATESVPSFDETSFNRAAIEALDGAPACLNRTLSCVLPHRPHDRFPCCSWQERLFRCSLAAPRLSVLLIGQSPPFLVLRRCHIHGDVDRFQAIGRSACTFAASRALGVAISTSPTLVAPLASGGETITVTRFLSVKNHDHHAVVAGWVFI